MFDVRVPPVEYWPGGVAANTPLGWPPARLPARLPAPAAYSPEGSFQRGARVFWLRLGELQFHRVHPVEYWRQFHRVKDVRCFPSPIQRTPDTQPRLLHDVRVNLRRRHIFVAEQLLQRPNIITCLQKMRRERMPQRVATRPLVNLRQPHRHLHHPLHTRLMQMMPPQDSSLSAPTALLRIGFSSLWACFEKTDSEIESFG